MYCGQCGKKIIENMLFCPFCGSPIVIPDQDDAPAAPESAHVRDSSAAPEAAAVREHSDVSAAEVAQERSTASEVETVRERFAASEAAAAREVSDAQTMPAAPERPEVRDAEAADRETEDSARTTAEKGRADRPVSLFDDFPEAPSPKEEVFVPLSFDDDTPAKMQGEAEMKIASAPVEIEDARPEPVASRRPAPREIRRPESARRRVAQTYIPVKDVDPEDMFMDGGTAMDDYDDYDLDEGGADYREDFAFEEDEPGGFFQRHIRGVVGLALLLILLAICVVWAFSPRGQRTLAKVNLAWTAQPYADLGYEAYRQDSDLLAARYYEKALARDETNYEYAHSAMVAYYEAEEIDSAANMLKKCIAMNPDSPEPYQEMLILYPDAQKRPWEIRELIRQGYERTGNAALKQD